jgi:hypothetical protein
MREGGERRGRRDIAGRTGLLFGLLFGGIFIARDVIESYPGGSAAGTDSLFALLAVLAVLCGPLAAGWRAARASGGVGHGVYAGFLSGGVGALLWSVQLIALPAFVPLAAAQFLGLGSLQGSALCSIPLFAGIGAFDGWIGGWIGAVGFRRAREAEKAARKATRRS